MISCNATLVVVMTFVVAAGGTLSADTIAYWKFENDLLDASGHGNHAVATGTSYSGDVFDSPVPGTGSTNTASLALPNPINFPPPALNAGHYLEVADDPSLDFTAGSFTIEAWVWIDQTGNNPMRQYLLQKKNRSLGDATSAFIFLPKAGNLADSSNQHVMALGLPDGTSSNMIFSSLGVLAPDDDSWHYMSVAVNRANGDVRFVLDDQVDLQPGAALGMAFDGNDNNETLYIGAHPTTANSSFPDGANHGLTGGIDELRISNVYLSEAELLVVPEPDSIFLGALGMLSLVVLVWRRRAEVQRQKSQSGEVRC